MWTGKLSGIPVVIGALGDVTPSWRTGSSRVKWWERMSYCAGPSSSQASGRGPKLEEGTDPPGKTGQVGDFLFYFYFPLSLYAV